MHDDSGPGSGRIDSALSCDRCGRLVRPGRGDYYAVGIVAVADPAGPVFTEEDLDRDVRGEIAALLEAIEGMSERELCEQVHRRVRLVLCVACYRRWIADPVGRGERG